MNDQERLLLEQRAVEALKKRIAGETFLTINDVRDRMKLSRQVIEGLPMEILPFVPYGSKARTYRRYHPADVLAAEGRLRAWNRAKTKGEGEAYLRKLRDELDRADQLAHEAAIEMRTKIA